MKKYLLVEGKTYIRVAPFGTKFTDYSYCTDPMIFKGYADDGDLVFEYANAPLNGELTNLDPAWNDGNWIPYSSIKRMKKTSLNSCKGQMVARKDSIKKYGKSIICTQAKLICATKYHVIVDDKMFGVLIYDNRFARPEDWILASEI
ncbi:MAG: hypothetical protein MJ245_06015 [Clostridia bacterium]|nr:hypothetical protein [Clostridia bacterium]